MNTPTNDWLIGHPAPPLSLPVDGDGGSFSLTGLRGRPVLVTFLSHAA